MAEIDLPTAGVLDYEDVGSGPPVVLLHGLLMDSSLWRHAIRDLRRDYRVIAPTLPLGSHRRPMRPDADLSLRGQARIVIEFLDRLGLRDVTLVGIDTGSGLAQLVVQDRPDLVSRLVLMSAEVYDNYPPGVPGHVIWLVSQVPGGIYLALQPLRLRAFQRLPLTLGWMSKRPVERDVMEAWLRPALSSRAIRRDVRKYVRGARRDGGMIRAASERLSSFDRPTLILWATEDRIFPAADGRRLAGSMPNATLVEVEDSYTLIPEDKPAEVSRHLREFLAGGAGETVPA